MQERSFNFNFPLEVFKDKNKNWRIKGLASTEDKDLQGEIIKQNGLDISTLKSGKGYINWEHRNDPSNIIGLIDNAEVTDKGLFVEGQLFRNHDQAKAVYQILDSLDDSRKHRIQMSVEGKVISKSDANDEENSKIIERAKLTAVALTMNPVNEKTYAELIKSLNYKNSAGQPAEGGFDSSFPPSAPLLNENKIEATDESFNKDLEVKNEIDSGINAEDNKDKKKEDVKENLEENKTKEEIKAEVVDNIKENITVEVNKTEEIKNNEPIQQVESNLSTKEEQGNNNTININCEMDSKENTVVSETIVETTATISKATIETSDVVSETKVKVSNTDEAASTLSSEDVFKCIESKLENSEVDPIIFLKSLKEKLTKDGATLDIAIVDELDSNDIVELFNDVRNTIANSYTYDVLDKFSKLKSHFDKSIEDGDSEKLKKLQANFFSWYNKLHSSKDDRYSEVANKVKSLAVALNTLIDSLKNKEHELEKKQLETQKSINEIKDILKAKTFKNK